MLLEDSWGIVMSMNMRLFDKYKPYPVNGFPEEQQMAALMNAAQAIRHQENSDNGEKKYIEVYENESAVSGSDDSADDAFKADTGTNLSLPRAQF